MQPTLGRIVHYRGKLGIQAMHAATVIVDWDNLVLGTDLPQLTSKQHVHLWVFSPNKQGGFVEYDVEEANRINIETELIPPGTWCWPPRV